ncbi:MAG: hypothetical protein ACRDCI_02780, partial [Plesiomonas shigelloides]
GELLMAKKVRALVAFTLTMCAIPLAWLAGLCLVGWKAINAGLKVVVIDLWKDLKWVFNG